MTEAAVDASKHYAETIGRSLVAYKEKEGRYPRTLDALVPRYIDEIRPPVAGYSKWQYAVLSDDSYILSFGRGTECYPGHHYDGKHWRFDT